MERSKEPKARELPILSFTECRKPTAHGSVLTATRTPGFYVGEVGNYDSAESSILSLAAQSKGPVKAMTLNYKEILKKISKRPELEADMRAGILRAIQTLLLYQGQITDEW